MKLFIASDLHGCLPAVQQMLEQFEQSQSTKLILLGDLLYHGPRNPLPTGYDPATVVTFLNRYQDKIIAVRGNCDSEVDAMVLDFPIAATYQKISFASRNLFITHGHHYDPNNLPQLDPNDVFIYGHTHLPQAIKVKDLYCFNPGSIGIPKGGYPASYGIVTDGGLGIFNLWDASPLVQIRF